MTKQQCRRLLSYRGLACGCGSHAVRRYNAFRTYLSLTSAKLTNTNLSMTIGGMRGLFEDINKLRGSGVGRGGGGARREGRRRRENHRSRDRFLNVFQVCGLSDLRTSRTAEPKSSWADTCLCIIHPMSYVALISTCCTRIVRCGSNKYGTHLSSPVWQ